MHCSCTDENVKSCCCCDGGWKVVSLGSRRITTEEDEGTALAVVWSIEHALQFVLSCKNLHVLTNSKSLEKRLSRNETQYSQPNVYFLKLKHISYQII